MVNVDVNFALQHWNLINLDIRFQVLDNRSQGIGLYLSLNVTI